MKQQLLCENENPMTAQGPATVDSANQEFYAKFPYPRPPLTFPQLEDPDFETVMLNQSIGDFTHRTISTSASIWVAGCGTNQAVYTALRFPKATVLGSDLSPASLEIAAKNAASLGIRNLTLRQESLNDVDYSEEFDYILSTGVIHHNAQPEIPLANIARALRPNGVLELMVYNRYHRLFNTAVQKVVRMIAGLGDGCATYDEQFATVQALAATEHIASSFYMAALRDAHSSHLADALMQPVEYNYTVESLQALVSQCGLQLFLPCNDQFDLMANRVWTIEFSTAQLQQQIDNLPDVVKWQITNLLLLERSPMLWFFVRHQRAGDDGRYEARLNQKFLSTKFVPAATQLLNYVRGTDMNYTPSSTTLPYPTPPRHRLVLQIRERADGRSELRQILNELGADITSYKAITDLRVLSTTSLCPYLKAVR
jgi:SAM-dependent methyltransferase